VVDVAAGALPAVAFEAFVGEDHPFFLDKAIPDCHGLGHFSYIGVNPFLVIRGKGDKIAVQRRSQSEIITGNPFDVLAKAVRNFCVEGDRMGIPFTGGAVGYLAYDLGRFLERLPQNAVDDQEFPDIYFAFYDRVLAFDHRSGAWRLCRTTFRSGEPETMGEEARRIAEKIDSAAPAALDDGSFHAGGSKSGAAQIKTRGLNPLSAGLHVAGAKSGALESNFTKEKYIEAVERALEYIRAGDIYQVNLSQRFRAPLIEHPYATYRRLRELNAAPMASYLGFNGIAVLSSSPERFLKVSGREVETRPIKGTRPRGRDPEEDLRHKRQLLASEKDRAELNMIVDLERNDLGRVCEYGSVRVTRHAAVESYATVHHLVSTIDGVMREGLDVIDLLRASFPGGSITGAPKIRAMEIIDELEPTARSVYTGSIGYIGFDRNADLNIAIRTLIAGQNNVTFQVGGGIVADSAPEHEYIETLVKGQAIFETLDSPR